MEAKKVIQQKKAPDFEPFDPFAEKNRTIVRNLQGNILKGHDRDHAALFFLRFKLDKIDAVKQRIAAFADFITSFELQMKEWQLYHSRRIPGGTFANFFLTANGYEALGYPKALLQKKGFDRAFLEGMPARSGDLNDPDPERYWEEPYRNTENIHAMLLIADDDLSVLGQKVRFMLRDVLPAEDSEEVADIVHVERAIQRRDDIGLPIEHFGFRDGISNPLFLTTDREKIEEYGGVGPWDPWANLDLVLFKDHFGEDDGSSFGSYLVYRKYEQHVGLFETLVRRFARNLKFDSDNETDREKVKALILGRFSDGTPVTLKRESYGTGYSNRLNDNYNNFTYDDDTLGSKCPFHAHIRKANSREEANKTRRIVRRGMTYGSRDSYAEKQGLQPSPDCGVGLFFMCFQNSIIDQFEYIQKTMANNPEFPKQGTGVDPIMGQSPFGEKSPSQNWPMEWGKIGYNYSDAIRSCVTLKGGEYFFAPSITFLRGLGNRKTKKGP